MRCLAALLLILLGIPASPADDHAVVLVYHHVSTETPALTSVTPTVFESHLDYLQEHDFTVWPLARIIAALDNGEEVPANTVAITFDDAYQSIYSEAFPRLRKRAWPFTIFVSSEGVDRGYANYLDWPQLRELAKAGVELGNHSHSHAHLVRRLGGESELQWKNRVGADIDSARQRLMEETGTSSRLFAYPYGEYSEDLKVIVKERGYYGIAQRSGAIGGHSDFLALPRFPMARNFADLQRFATSVNSRPLPVTSVSIGGNGEPSYRPIDKLGLTLADGDYRAQQLACYRASGRPLSIETSVIRPLAVSIDVSGEQPPGRHKINCTAPASKGRGVFYWYSFQWLVKRADGSWYQE